MKKIVAGRLIVARIAGDERAVDEETWFARARSPRYALSVGRAIKRVDGPPWPAGARPTKCARNCHSARR